MRILIAEDEPSIVRLWIRQIMKYFPDCEVVHADTVETARTAFETNPDFDLILMDGCLNQYSSLDTPELIQAIRRSYTGPMLAVSGGEFTNEVLVNEGCDHSVLKPDAAEVIILMLMRIAEK